MKANHSERVLAIYPITRGFAYCLFEGPGQLHDWGIRHVGKAEKNAACLAGIEKLIARYDPHAVVIEDVSDHSSRRSARICHLYRDLERMADRLDLSVYAYPWPVVFKAYERFNPQTRHDLAVAIAGMIPQLARRLPPRRKIWLPTDPRQALFDGAALALTHYTVQH